ncbi:serine protease [Candidatus Parcubacteria bacterium]|nr:serine protease [Patescibacteria group bacterium]MBU4381203.1 serine protease [Patescibacteria group bacterium]MCG2689235.1 serine protease [Candidatus Parcubacteria bacterium]
MSKKNRKNKKYQGPKPPKRPENFHSFSECIKWLKKSVYIVVRGRKVIVDEKEGINWITLGSGFVAAPSRFVTAAHVINDPEKGELAQHQDGDKYYLLRHDDENNWHCRIFEPKLDREIFVFADIDLALIYLDSEFYQVGDKIFADRNDFIRISKEFLPIGSEVGVLGYPLCKLEFQEKDINKPLIGNVLLRADQGVVNCRYQTSEKDFLYEFTLAFNPGNSGGPIFDTKTGKVVSIVKGYKVLRINERENVISDEGVKQLKVYKEKAFIETLNATYSFGFATPTFLEVFKKHNIIS